MHGTDQLLTRMRVKPGLVFTAASPHLGDDHQLIRIGLMIGAEGGSRTRTLLRGTNLKPVARVLTSFYCALPSNIYRRFSRQSKLRLAWYEHVSPSSSPHPSTAT